jgi:hypothetical protein
MQSNSMTSDIYAQYKPRKNLLIDLFVVEIKKPRVNASQQIESGFVKLNGEVQHLLNALIDYSR